MELFKSIFNPYERNARLFPAVIVLVPVLVAVYAMFPDTVNYFSATIGSVFFLAFCFLLGKLSRNIGKRKEEELIKKWDGLPTTRFLRHRDKSIDIHTKGRYHNFLEKHVPNLGIPTADVELADSINADIVYKSAAKWLLNKTRDTSKYNLLFRENISYGFARNFWALKYWGLLLNVTVLIVTIVFAYYSYNLDPTLIPGVLWISIAIDLAVIIIFILFTEKAVHSKAKAYARTLLEVCDE